MCVCVYIISIKDNSTAIVNYFYVVKYIVFLLCDFHVAVMFLKKHFLKHNMNTKHDL